MNVRFAVLSLEIRPLAALHPPPGPLCKKYFMGCKWCAQWCAHSYSICASFYCISLKLYMRGEGYNAPKGLISRDIARFAFFHIYKQRHWNTNSYD